MKSACTLKTTALLLAALATTPAAFAQLEIYQLTGGISASAEGLITDAGNVPFGQSPAASSQGNSAISLGVLTDTIYLNTSSMTVRQVAVFSAFGATTTVLNETHTVSGQNVSATLSVSQGLTGGKLTLDTGAQPVVWDAVTKSYTYANQSFIPTLLNVPISGSYSLVTGGQTYGGNFSYNLQPSGSAPSLFTTFSQSPNQLSLALGGVTDFNGFAQSPGGILPNITAADGFQMDLFAGDADDRMQNFSWNSSSSAAMMVPSVPEPGTYALLGMGLAVLVHSRRGKIPFLRRQ